MRRETGFLLILENGAGGNLHAADENEARHRVSHVAGHGWLFRYDLDGFPSGRRHQRRARMVELRLISTLGCPSTEAMAAALEAAGKRQSVEYHLIPQGGE